MLLLVYVLVTLISSLQSVSIPPHLFSGNSYLDYNNYVIFKQSFSHLVAQKNLYAQYPVEYWDLYKYSPTFALFMSLFAYFPDIVGLSLWNICNALVLFAAVRMLPFKNRTHCLLLWFILLELLTSLQNSQSNGIMAGLFIAAFAYLQRNKMLLASLCLVIATFIKVYGAIGFCLFLFYPDKIKFILYSILWTVLFALLPLVVTPFQTLVWQYNNWAAMMLEDHSASYGLSVMGWLQSWFGINEGKNIVSITGFILFTLPFVRYKMYNNEVYKLMMLAFMMIWVIIFNHKAESPTFIIAVAGIGIWYFSQPYQHWRRILLVFVFIFTCLSPTDIFPAFIKEHFFDAYNLKVVPCILLWVILLVEIMSMKKEVQLPNYNMVEM
jgi:Glycosyltransferase family 87